jgi:hypothetical protein
MRCRSPELPLSAIVRGLLGDLVGVVILGVCWGAYFQVPLPGIRRVLKPAQGPITLAVLSTATVILAILIGVQIARIH